MATKGENVNGKIYELMPKVAAAIGAIGKDQTNSFHRYNFRGIDQVYDAAHGPLTDHGVFVTTEVLDMVREDRETKKGETTIHTVVTMRVSFVASDGSSVSSVTVGEGNDSGDKSAMKAMSAAVKNAFFQTFTIPINDSRGVDGDHESPEAGKPKKAPKPNPADNTDTLREIAKMAEDNGVTRDELSAYVKRTFKKPSTKLTEGELNALTEWIYTKGEAA